MYNNLYNCLKMQTHLNIVIQLLYIITSASRNLETNQTLQPNLYPEFLVGLKQDCSFIWANTCFLNIYGLEKYE